MPLSIKFIKSAVHPQDYPPGQKPEIAITGRSNAGKSSLINALSHQANVAKVSKVPGKTRLLNFFDVGHEYRFVDMPGYGFAARSGDEMQDWHKMIESYFSIRAQVAGLILVMDIRRDWSEDEELLKNFTTSLGLPLMIVPTKIDKLTRNEINQKIQKLKKQAQSEYLFPVSSLKKTGFEEMEEFMYQELVKPKLAELKGKT